MSALQIGASLLEVGLGGWNVLETNRLNEEALAANQARYDEVQQGYQDMMGSTAQTYNRLGQDTDLAYARMDAMQGQDYGRWQTALDTQDARSQGLIGNYYTNAMQEMDTRGDASLQQLNQMGQQARDDNQMNWRRMETAMGRRGQRGQQATAEGYAGLRGDASGGYNRLQARSFRQTDQAMGDTAGRYGDLQSQVASGYGGAMADTQGRYDQLAGTTLDRYSAGQQGAADLYGGYAEGMDARQQGRYDTAMGMLEGAGDQRRKDIEEAWQGQASQGGQDMVSRGLTGTTIQPTMQAGYERQKQAEMGRLDEGLRQDRLNLHTGLTGESAAANERIMGAGFGTQSQLQQAGLGAATNIGQMGAGAVGQLQATGLGAATNIGQAGVSDLGQIQQTGIGTDIALGQQGVGTDINLGQAGVGAGMNWAQTNLANQMGIGSAYAQSDLGLGSQNLGMNQQWMGNQLGMRNAWQQGQVGARMGQMGQYNQIQNAMQQQQVYGYADRRQQQLGANTAQTLGAMNAQNQLQSTALAYTDAVQNPYHDSSQGWNMMAQGLSNLTYQPPKANTDNTGDYILGGAMLGAAAISDRRLKEHFGTIEDPLAKINAITGKTYHFKSVQDDNHRDAGVIAQDVEAVLPEAVIEREGVKYVKYEAVIALLVEATKALTRRIEQLEEAK